MSRRASSYLSFVRAYGLTLEFSFRTVMGGASHDGELIDCQLRSEPQANKAKEFVRETSNFVFHGFVTLRGRMYVVDVPTVLYFLYFFRNFYEIVTFTKS